MYEISICHLYPDLLNLYGDRGNIIALKKRCEWRGINVNVSDVSVGDKFDSELYDIVFLGGGQNYEQEIVLKDLMDQKKAETKNAIESDKVFLAICGGFQLLGSHLKTPEGKETQFLDAIDFWTLDSKERMFGNLVFECDFLKKDEFDGRVVGFENHSGKTYLGTNVKPLGTVIKGYGNNGEDGSEGAIYKNVYCSYSHGSLLPRNPKLADHLISLSLKQKYSYFVSLSCLNDHLEVLANQSMINKLMG